LKKTGRTVDTLENFGVYFTPNFAALHSGLLPVLPLAKEIIHHWKYQNLGNSQNGDEVAFTLKVIGME